MGPVPDNICTGFRFCWIGGMGGMGGGGITEITINKCIIMGRWSLDIQYNEHYIA